MAGVVFDRALSAGPVTVGIPGSAGVPTVNNDEKFEVRVWPALSIGACASGAAVDNYCVGCSCK